MTLNTLQEQYNAYKAGLLTESRFSYLLRYSQHNRLFAPTNTLSDKLRILKSHKLIHESAVASPQPESKYDESLNAAVEKKLDEISPGVLKTAAQQAGRAGRVDQANNLSNGYDKAAKDVNTLFRNKALANGKVAHITVDRNVITLQVALDRPIDANKPFGTIQVDMTTGKVNEDNLPELSEQDQNLVQQIVQQVMPKTPTPQPEPAPASAPTMEQRLDAVLHELESKDA